MGFDVWTVPHTGPVTKFLPAAKVLFHAVKIDEEGGCIEAGNVHDV